MEIAATLAYYGFLSLMPLLLLTLVVTEVFLRTTKAGLALISVISSIFPAFNPDLLNDITEIASSNAISVVSIALLVWAMTPLSGALRTALARIFKMPLQRPFLKSKLLDLIAALVFAILFLALILLRAAAPSVDPSAKAVPRILAWLCISALPFGLCVIYLGLFFRIFAPVHLTWRQWLLGAVCVALLWVVMRILFVSFVEYNPNYGYAFGSLKSIFLFIVLVYYSFATLLFGAEVMANTFRRDALLLRRLLDPPTTGDGRHASLMSKFERRLESGKILFREGDAGIEMYVVLDGRIRLSRNDMDLAVMTRGNYFGEMSLLNHAPRSATATALEDSRLASVTRQNFDLLVRENPILVRNMLEELARRLAATNEKLKPQ